MNEARTLNQLQTIDLEVDALTQESEDVQARMGETEELLSARERRDEDRQKLQQLQTAQQELEWEVERLTEKIAKEEDQLYHGRGKTPRELDAIRREVELLKDNRREVEDRILEVMTDVEKAQEELESSQADLVRIAAEWETQQGELAERQTAITRRLAELNRARQAVAVTLPSDTLASYEDLRRMRRGLAVAHVERNTCLGCRISLPVNVVQHARAGRELVHCPSCGRILFVDR